MIIDQFELVLPDLDSLLDFYHVKDDYKRELEEVSYSVDFSETIYKDDGTYSVTILVVHDKD